MLALEASSFFIAHPSFLEIICEHFRPETVLEFGPGNSTSVILEKSQARIVSIEESKKWYRKYRSKFPQECFQLYYKESGWDLSELDNLGGPYDLIFVDGGDRTNELKYCFNLLAPNGIVFLHDAHRQEYEPGIRSYPHIFFPERHSCIVCKSSDVMKKLKQIITQDMNCRCQYCDTEIRNRYLAQFVEGC